jgi:hypothetical protein
MILIDRGRGGYPHQYQPVNIVEIGVTPPPRRRKNQPANYLFWPRQLAKLPLHRGDGVRQLWKRYRYGELIRSGRALSQAALVLGKVPFYVRFLFLSA